MAREIDSLTSPTLKHLRDRWWDDSFATFLDDALQPAAGARVLDVGCGPGTAELHLGLDGRPAVKLVGIDVVTERVRAALASTRARGVPVSLAAAAADCLPFGDEIFDAVFCVAVLQHLRDPSPAIAEFARVTTRGGRIVVVEPDNDARYWYSSSALGDAAFESGVAFFGAGAVGTDEAHPRLGPTVSSLFLDHGIQPLAVHLFPVSVSRLGAPASTVWASRRALARRLVERTPDEAVKRLGGVYAEALERYAADAERQGPAFVEIQNTMLFATIGHRVDRAPVITADRPHR
jgi:SAM-dependent methyltransferase